MKKALLLIVLCCAAAPAQTGDRISIELGTATVWLGMDRAAAKQQIEAAGMTFDESANSKGQVLAINAQSKRAFTLKFQDNRLVFAEREWLSNGSGGLPSVVDALAALADQGAVRCSILHAPVSDPDTKMDRIVIECGQRGVILTVGSARLDSGNSASENSVSETIGRYR
jgi:hypothetical protein